MRRMNFCTWGESRQLMKVLFILESAMGLGETIRVEEIFRSLVKSGFHVCEVVPPSISFDYLRKKGICEIFANLLPLHRTKPLGLGNPLVEYINLNLMKNYLSRLGRTSDFGAVFAEGSNVGWHYLRSLGKEWVIPLIVDVHGLAAAEARGKNDKSWHKKEMLEVELFRNCEHLAVVSSKMKEYLVHNYAIPAEKITLTYNGARSPKSKARYRHPMRVIYAGIFDYWEGIDIYLELAKRSSPLDYEFYMAGSGPMLKQVLKRTRREHIPIEYLGCLPRSEMLDVMSKMQIGVAPSSRDTAREVAFPIKVLDYMSCGLPVIASGVGEWGQMIEKEDCGIVLHDDSIENYRNALENLKNENLWRHKSSKGIEAVKTRYSWDGVLLPLTEVVKRFSK